MFKEVAERNKVCEIVNNDIKTALNYRPVCREITKLIINASPRGWRENRSGWMSEKENRKRKTKILGTSNYKIFYFGPTFSEHGSGGTNLKWALKIFNNTEGKNLNGGVFIEPRIIFNESTFVRGRFHVSFFSRIIIEYSLTALAPTFTFWFRNVFFELSLSSTPSFKELCGSFNLGGKDRNVAHDLAKNWTQKAANDDQKQR